MNNKFLEDYYENVILPRYKSESIGVVIWKDHGQVGPDNWAHYFEDGTGNEYVLLNEDYPGGIYLNDDLTHDVIPFSEANDPVLQVSFGGEWIPNISGYFTLFKERSRT
jgi:hypothetical protein